MSKLDIALKARAQVGLGARANLRFDQWTEGDERNDSQNENGQDHAERSAQELQCSSLRRRENESRTLESILPIRRKNYHTNAGSQGGPLRASGAVRTLAKLSLRTKLPFRTQIIPGGQRLRGGATLRNRPAEEW